MRLNQSLLNIYLAKLLTIIIGKYYTKALIIKLKKSDLDKLGVLFIHIPKAAGTSITDVLYGRRIGHFTLVEYRNFLGEEFIDSKFKFTVVRNPINRLYSAWKFARSGGTADGAVSNHRVYQDEIFKSFDSFVLNWLQYQDLDKCEVLFRTQCHFIDTLGYKNLKLDAIYQVERLCDLESKLSEILNKPVKFPKKNVLGGTLNLSFIDSKTIAKICELYACDFQAFGYKYPSFDLNV